MNAGDTTAAIKPNPNKIEMELYADVSSTQNAT